MQMQAVMIHQRRCLIISLSGAPNMLVTICSVLCRHGKHCRGKLQTTRIATKTLVTVKSGVVGYSSSASPETFEPNVAYPEIAMTKYTNSALEIDETMTVFILGLLRSLSSLQIENIF
mmetsp:Transcript_16606/g.23259  ORF Transcript_16606/g.23259 Transcript_16606/m.23259 type:complete len:118 (-) Transcript_16606:182-535(-)